MNGKKLFAKIADNWPAKALSLAIAVVLYMFHSMSALDERYFSVPLSIEAGGNLVPSKPYPRMVRVSLRADANSLYPIVESDIEAYVDLSKYDVPGDYRAEVLVRKTGTALSADALEIRLDPTGIDLALDYKISKFVPLNAIVRGRVEPGYELVSYTLNPSRVVIDGPAELISGISELYTDFVDLEGRDEDFIATVNILNRDPFIVVRGGNSTEFHGYIGSIDAAEISPQEDGLLPEDDLALAD